MRLDSRTIAQLKLPDGKSDAIFWDGKVTGFGYRLRRSGDEIKGTYIYQFRFNGRTQRFLIGKVEEITAAQAREQAEKARAQVRLEHNPQQEKEDKRRKERPHTMRAIVEGYGEGENRVPGYLELRKDELRQHSYHEIRRYLTGPYFRALHSADIGSITRRDVAMCLNAISKGRGRVAAARARTTLSAFFSWCMKQGISDLNPVIGTGKPEQPEARERVLTDQELAAVWTACEEDDFGHIVRLLILTGARRTEIGGMQRAEIDFDAAKWTLPKERAKNGKAHTLPLHSMALGIIRSVPVQFGRDHLFGTKAKIGFTSWVEKAALDKRVGITGWTLHDIRRTVATRMGDIGVQPHIVEQILNHVSGHRAGVAGIYLRSVYEREVTQALALWESHIAGLIGGERVVVPLFEQRASGS
jgi:integrase